MQAVSPVGSGTQIVPGGQSPSHVGNGDCSHGTFGGSQRHAPRLPTKTQVWLGSGHGPSQVGATESSQGISSQRHVAMPLMSMNGLQIVPGGQSPSQTG
jgi:hypothetical protein